MTHHIETTSGRLAIHGEMTIYNARELKEQLCKALQGEADLREIDLTQVTELDSAGVQLLLSLEQWAQRQQRELAFAGGSAAVREVLELLQITLAGGSIPVQP